jgi:hypothetical protein
MKWRNVLGVGSKTLPIWAALCTGRADGSDQKYPAQAKHAILAMVRAQESDAENAICSLLQSKGWVDPTIQKLKKLVKPFDSDDPIMRDCHERAAKSGAGIVVYSDPIEDA